MTNSLYRKKHNEISVYPIWLAALPHVKILAVLPSVNRLGHVSAMFNYFSKRITQTR